MLDATFHAFMRAISGDQHAELQGVDPNWWSFIVFYGKKKKICAKLTLLGDHF